MKSSATTLVSLARKGVIAALVFVATFVLVGKLRPVVMSDRPLPGGNEIEGPCAVWFVGSSTIARWNTLAQDMAPWQTENRGVGGALIGELTSRFESEETPEPPGTLVIYVGDNDLAAGDAAREVAVDMAKFVATIRTRMPHARLILLGLKPSPARWSLRPEQLRLDALIRERISAQPRVTYADVGPSLLIDGQPGPFFAEDGIHLNGEGYRRWGAFVRRAVERSVPRREATRCTRRAPVTA